MVPSLLGQMGVLSTTEQKTGRVYRSLKKYTQFYLAFSEEHRKVIYIEGCVFSVWEKDLLTIEESARYFGIGENKLRRTAEENEDSDYILSNGNQRLIKWKRFEQYLIV